MPHAEIVQSFLKGAVITYPCWGPEGGMVLARFRNGQVQHRHETSRTVHREPMDRYKASAMVPFDARLFGEAA